MNSKIGERIVTQGQAGGAQQNLNVGVFEQAVIALPGIDEQDAICKIVDACYECEGTEGAYAETLRSVKSALMSVLLTGEVRVTPDATAA
jgi:type I restriction enzyme S subunit